MPSPELALELRTARPGVSDQLRERVRAVAGEAEPARRPTTALPSWRRMSVFAAAATVAAGVGVAVFHGVTARPRSTETPVASVARPAVEGSSKFAPTAPQRALLTPTRSRLQQYAASLHVQVKDRTRLSDATKRAMRVARLLGGYVSYTRYSAPSHGRGSASIVVRVPIDRVDDAIAEYSDLGTIVAQNVSILDVTKAVEEQAKEIARLRADIAQLEAGGVTAGERPRLDAEKARLDYLTKRRNATVRRAQLARVVLELTTKPTAAAAPASRFHRTMSGAGGVLLRELELLVYALIVAGPLLLIGAGVIAAGRVRDRRLFERA